MSDNLIGATTAIFIVSLSIAVTEPVNVAWSTRDGTAKAGTDYQAANGVVSFLPGETTKQIEVIVYGQNVSPTGDKNFFINLMPPTNAVLGTTLIEAVIKVEDESGVPVTSVIVAQGKRGLKGNPGLSAYEQAVLMGYEGTVEDWMREQADAAAAAQRASDYAAAAASAATKAENAATAASFLGNIFPTPEAGVDPVTGVGNGAYYNVRSPDDDSFLVEYQNIGGVPTPSGKSYPSSAFVQQIADNMPLPYKDGKMYEQGDRVRLDNGYVVESTSSNNTNNPNFDMTKWVKVVNLIIANTVAELITKNLKNGDIVKTVGYYNIFDDGGAFYVISDTATDYSIPLDNGKHAVFSDTFDIRKFGIINSPTLNQTAEIKRMIAYADSRVYEIDFLNYELMVPKIWTALATWGLTKGAMGMCFEKTHKLKNLRVVHDKTVRLETGMCQIIFAPTENAKFEEWFVLENVEFDSWNTNYQPRTENYLGNADGYRHGFVASPKFGSTVGNWDILATNYSFHFKNINFITPAYSYNLSLHNIHAKNVTFENLTGQYVGIYLVYTAQVLRGKVLDVIQRKDYVEAGRSLVGNAIHYEGEYSNRSATFKGVEIDDARCRDSATNLPHSVFVYHGLGDTWLDYVKLSNISGHCRVKSVNLNRVELSNSLDGASFILESLKSKLSKITFRNWTTSGNVGSYGSAPYLLRTGEVGLIEMYNSTLVYPLYTNGGANTCVVDKLKMVDCVLENNLDTPGIGRSNLLHFKEIEIHRFVNKTPSGRLIMAKFDSLVIDDIDWGVGSTGDGIVQNYGETPATVTIKNSVSNKDPSQYNIEFRGLMKITIINSVFKFPFRSVPADVTITAINSLPYNVASVVYDPPSLAASGGSATKTVSLAGAKIGQPVIASFDQYNADIEVSAVVSAVNTVLVKFKNIGAAPIDLPSGTITVKLI